MLALIDESARAGRGEFHYVVAAAVVVVDDPDRLRAAIEGLVYEGGRTRHFHWANEGPRMRARLLQLTADMGVRAHVGVHRQVTDRGQEHARAVLLREVLLPGLVEIGATHLIIESRDDHVQSSSGRPTRKLGRLDDRDRQVVRDFLRPWRGGPTFEWVGKSEPLLWLPDAIAGAVREAFDDARTAWIDQLRTQGVLVDLGERG